MTSAVVALAFTGAGDIGPLLGIAVALGVVGFGLVYPGRRRGGAHT